MKKKMRGKKARILDEFDDFKHSVQPLDGSLAEGFVLPLNPVRAAANHEAPGPSKCVLAAAFLLSFLLII